MTTHRIARQVVEVIATDRAAAERLAGLVAQSGPILAAVIARVFDRVEGPAVHRLDRLVVTMPGRDPEGFAANWAAALEAALTTALRKALAARAPNDALADALDLLTAYAGSGRLPWWAQGEAAPIAAAELLAASREEASADGLRFVLRLPDAAVRLARRLPQATLARLVARLIGATPDAVASSALALVGERSGVSIAAAADAAWRALLDLAARGPGPLPPAGSSPAELGSAASSRIRSIANRPPDPRSAWIERPSAPPSEGTMPVASRKAHPLAEGPSDRAASPPEAGVGGSREATTHEAPDGAPDSPATLPPDAGPPGPEANSPSTGDDRPHEGPQSVGNDRRQQSEPTEGHAPASIGGSEDARRRVDPPADEPAADHVDAWRASPSASSARAAAGPPFDAPARDHPAASPSPRQLPIDPAADRARSGAAAFPSTQQPDSDAADHPRGSLATRRPAGRRAGDGAHSTIDRPDAAPQETSGPGGSAALSGARESETAPPPVPLRPGDPTDPAAQPADATRPAGAAQASTTEPSPLAARARVVSHQTTDIDFSPSPPMERPRPSSSAPEASSGRMFALSSSAIGNDPPRVRRTASDVSHPTRIGNERPGDAAQAGTRSIDPLDDAARHGPAPADAMPAIGRSASADHAPKQAAITATNGAAGRAPSGSRSPDTPPSTPAISGSECERSGERLPSGAPAPFQRLGIGSVRSDDGPRTGAAPDAAMARDAPVLLGNDDGPDRITGPSTTATTALLSAGADRLAYAPPLRPASSPAHDAVYLDGAGVALLWPLFPDWFAHAGLWEARRGFVDTAASHRAAALIDHLVTDDRAPPEPRLPLAKLLSGLALDALHDPGPPVSDAEAAATRAMLTDVIAALPMLGRLSVAGLRSAWLARPGRLAVEHGGWVLRVERRPWDLLLDRMPWPLGAVALPWMPDPLRVLW